MSQLVAGQCNDTPDALEASLRRFLEGVLPDADDFPSLPAELAIDALIAGHVGLAFAVPEGAVGFGAGVALGAAVPEASVDEDGDFLLGEGKVGLSGQWKMPPPAGDLVLLQQGQQRVLRLFVAFAPNKGHDFGALSFGPDVSHIRDHLTHRSAQLHI